MTAEKQYKVLIVDDERSNLDVLVHILKNEYAVYPAKNGEIALKRAADVVPDVILLDVIMPDLNGFEVLTRLKDDELTRHIPVVIITGLDNAEDEKKALGLGAADYIVKPFNNDVVKARVRTQLDIVRQLREIDEFGMTDGVTQLPNRKSFDIQLGLEWARAIRENNPVSLVLIDIDNIETYKQEHGGREADKLLAGVTSCIRSTLKRTTDIMSRYSGTSVSVILPNTAREGLKKVVNNIRGSIGDSVITISIGAVSEHPAKEDSLSSFVLRAGANLAKAKETGDTAYY